MSMSRRENQGSGATDNTHLLAADRPQARAFVARAACSCILGSREQVGCHVCQRHLCHLQGGLHIRKEANEVLGQPATNTSQESKLD